ncbi:hypothetical protein KXD93_04800 [Mucilaginibacter sp. BJC16-A38]|uniref:hypothetical protein n=1 Tax=Mucilaginibacter phenanthrenivorans TaxID=1234842 RepID=UPI0021580D99|nr:hypothetical protein [Mucilaginibacter phenanthrenivorans]MCR8556945.1 hypothetical protein [Mucilaginibacter phenanthrenivorans]
MRNLAFLAIAVTSLFTACNSGNAIKDFIPGTYISQAQSEFSVANDTLVIEAAKSTDNLYLITRKTGYRRITNGKVQTVQHKVKHWTGEWDTQRQVLEVVQTGNTFVFQPDQHCLLNGNSEYRKL